METNELIDMLKMIRENAEPIQTPDGICGYSTLVKDVRCDDSFTWVIDEAIKALSSGNKKGKWIDYSDDGFVECPFCGSCTTCEGNKDELHFCFNCGADMRSEAQDVHSES